MEGMEEMEMEWCKLGGWRGGIEKNTDLKKNEEKKVKNGEKVKKKGEEWKKRK